MYKIKVFVFSSKYDVFNLLQPIPPPKVMDFWMVPIKYTLSGEGESFVFILLMKPF